MTEPMGATLTVVGTSRAPRRRQAVTTAGVLASPLKRWSMTTSSSVPARISMSGRGSSPLPPEGARPDQWPPAIENVRRTMTDTSASASAVNVSDSSQSTMGLGSMSATSSSGSRSAERPS